MDRSFLLALRYFVKTDMLPLTSSQLGELMSKSAYPEAIEIKKSSYKKFGKLLKSKAKLGFIKIKDQRNEVSTRSIVRLPKLKLIENEFHFRLLLRLLT